MEELVWSCKLSLGYSTSFDDKERLLKMAMKIDSSDSYVLERNQDQNDLQMLRVPKRLSRSLGILFKLWKTLDYQANRC